MWGLWRKWSRMDIKEMQLSFTSWLGNTNAIFILKQIREKYLGKNNFYFVYGDLEQAFDRVPMDVVRWSLREQAEEEWLVKIVRPMYRSAYGQAIVNGASSAFNEFLGQIILDQGSLLRSLLFIIVLEKNIRKIWRKVSK